MVYEILAEANKAKTDADKVRILQENNSLALRCVLKGVFNPKCQFVIKEPVPFKRHSPPPGLGKTTIDYEVKSIYLFEEGNPRVSPNVSLERKKALLAQILEYLEGPEADVFMGMILKKLPRDYEVSYDVVKTAFPRLVTS